VVDQDGVAVGTHDGAYALPSVSDAGCGSAGRRPTAGPRYVLEVQPVANRVVVGPVEALQVDRVEATDLVSFVEVADGTVCTAQVRAHGRDVRVVAPGRGRPAGRHDRGR